MRSKATILLLMAVILLLTSLVFMSCIQSSRQPKVYYYFSPRCPNCIAVDPLINFLKNNSSIKFDICNVDDFKNCTNESKEIAYMVKKKLGFFGTPIAVVFSNGKTKIFIGKYQVLNMVKYLSNSTKLPEVSLNNSRFSVKDCIECHEKRNISPPSHYSCTYCCHNIG